MYKKSYVENPAAVFSRAPLVQDVAIEFGIENPESITAMYEVFLRATNMMDMNAEYSRGYDDGYDDGYDEGIDDAASKISSIEWDLESLKKKR